MGNTSSRQEERPEYWVFDLDNTLYCPSLRLFDQINTLMTRYIARKIGVDTARANDLRQHYWRRYGTTLAGLVAEHSVPPGEFLDETHQLDLAHVTPDTQLRAAIEKLSGRKLVHTNGPRAHAANILSARGLTGVFDQIVALEDTDLTPKPSPSAYDSFIRLTGIDPERAVMIEDHADNLVEPKRRGMTTVWLHHGRPHPGAHVDHAIDDLLGFLQAGA